jgi:hypothetical protein
LLAQARPFKGRNARFEERRRNLGNQGWHPSRILAADGP